jgi:ribosomal protein S27AE
VIVVAYRDDPTSKIQPPWNPDVVAALNRYQVRRQFHPFTCPSNHTEETLLEAHPDGWHCSRSYCGYTQGWAWTFMARENHSGR